MRHSVHSSVAAALIPSPKLTHELLVRKTNEHTNSVDSMLTESTAKIFHSCTDLENSLSKGARIAREDFLLFFHAEFKSHSPRSLNLHAKYVAHTVQFAKTVHTGPGRNDKMTKERLFME